MGSQWVKAAAAVLAAVAVVLQTAWPHQPWSLPVASAITAVIGALHLVPSSSTPAAGR